MGEEEICPALIRKNIVLAETGGELTLPLARLNTNCEFKKAWDEIQDKWHPIKRCYKCGKGIKEGAYCSEECKAHQKAYKKAYYQKPEVKAHQKAYKKAYYQRMKLQLSSVKKSI
jgi:hypothetical protein